MATNGRRYRTATLQKTRSGVFTRRGQETGSGSLFSKRPRPPEIALIHPSIPWPLAGHLEAMNTHSEPRFRILLSRGTSGVELTFV